MGVDKFSDILEKFSSIFKDSDRLPSVHFSNKKRHKLDIHIDFLSSNINKTRGGYIKNKKGQITLTSIDKVYYKVHNSCKDNKKEELI